MQIEKGNCDREDHRSIWDIIQITVSYLRGEDQGDSLGKDTE